MKATDRLQCISRGARARTLLLAVTLLLCPLLAPAADTIKVAYIKNTPGAPLFLLPEMGKKQGLDIELVEFKRYADARTSTATGQTQLGQMGPQDPSIMVAQGARKLLGVMGLAVGGDVVIVRRGVTIDKWEDFIGKKIGVAKGGISWLKFVASIERNGVDYSKLDIINLTGAPVNFDQALKKGDLDAWMAWEPFGATALLGGYGYYPITDHNATPEVGALNGIVAANKEWAEANPETAQKLVSLLVEAVDHLKANPAKWGGLLKDATGMDTPTISLSMLTTRLDYNLYQTTIENMTGFMHKVGLLRSDPSDELFKDFFTYKFLMAATGKSAVELGATR
ncbi:MAG: ABC transporter substrate-binding protein [Gammaproteobacteria bacterium]|nr:ABC transporter substrate-binding protein [Gammaproteobacteria bacterium]